ncbi:tetratricopeptide repeat protein [Hippea maritima]|uniref:Tetratricopeptide TPR_2 repeat-containing protein n=1 Tax=Hippea maritima (strain ATCC 700847 / DSM 10411 / MH2) TaxID=760142 RepID=F2LW56_HIPMA|nr:tetratricopeptide repeat protein [Hippea maritima]AEA33990.1 Tetratricopeptide TPR_2 repeat-containing protein [Hippea maritima DSM 10411]
MADEDRLKDQESFDNDEEVIIIEDEEEQKEQPEETEQEEEKHLEAEEVEELEKPKSNLWVYVGVAAAILIIVAVALFFTLHKKKPQSKKPEKTLVKTEKSKPKPKPKLKPKKPVAYNPVVDAHFIKAMRLQQKGKYKEALKQLKQATVDLYISYYGIAYVYLQMGEVEKAKEYLFDKTKNYLILAVHNNPNYINGYVNLFRIYMAQKNYKDALSMINALRVKGLDEKDVKLMQAYYNFVKDNSSQSIFELIKQYPNSPLLLGLAGDYYLKNNQPEEALKYFEKAIRLYPLGSVYYNIALINTQNGRYKSALRLIPKMYYMDIDKIRCKNYMAFFLLLRDSKFDAANRFLNLNKQYFDGCYRHFEIIPKVYSDLDVSSYSIRSNFNFILAAEILNMYLKPIKLIPEKANSNIKLGMVYQNLGLSEDAANEFYKAASFSEAVLLSQYASKYYALGDYKKSLKYYKLALDKTPTNPLLIYNVAIMSLKNHDIKTASDMLSQLILTYPAFPLPYLGMFIVKQIEGKHMDAIKYLGSFSQRLKSLDYATQKKLNALSVFSDYIIDRINFSQEKLKALSQPQKRVFLLFEAALGQDLDYLSIEKAFERAIGIGWNPSSLVSLCEYFFKNYDNDFIKRLMATMYLLNGQPQKAYQAMYNVKVYTAEDYYKLGVAYLLSGYPEIADNFFTKSILKGDNFYNAYVAKAIIQASKGSLVGVKYYLKIILKKEAKLAWLNTDVFLSYDIRLKK